MKKIGMTVLLLAVCGIFVAATPSGSQIDENAARKLAIDQYNHLFKDKFILNPVDKKHHPLPALEAKSFRVAEVKDGCWQLALDPPAGWFVYAKVSLDGKWVQITSAGFAPE
jgi:hypothetical protein